MSSPAAPFPWPLLEPVSRRLARGAGEGTRILERVVRFDALEAAASSVCSGSVRLAVHRVTEELPASALPVARAHLALADGSAQVTVAVPAALLVEVLGRLTGRAAHVPAPEEPLDPRLAGAWAAVVAEILRRAGSRVAVRPMGSAIPALGVPGATFRGTILLDDRPYDGAVTVYPNLIRSEPPALRASLRRLGNLPLEMGIVAGWAASATRDVATLRPGDIWVTDCTWPCHRVMLAAKRAEKGFWATLEGRRLQMVGGAANIPGAVDMSDNVEPEEAIAEAAAEAAVVVRIEVGSVTLTAREWADLRAGDVLETGIALAAQAALRVGGRVLARGELVSVDGELGVRIQEVAAAPIGELRDSILSDTAR